MAQKPKAPDWLIENIAEASKNARKIYFLYLGFLAYCALTVISTSDRQIILGETATLPILKIEVSLNGFFLLGPLIAILVFIYFQLYLHRLKGLIDDLRNNYTSTEKRRLYPWMVNIAEDPEPGAIGKLQRIIVSFSLWTSLTLVLILFALWYVKKHEPIWSYVVGSAPIVGFLITFWFWLRYEPDKRRKSAWRKIFYFIRVALIFALVATFELCLFLFLIPWAREGGKYGLRPIIYEWIRERIHPIIYVNLSYQNLVLEPEKDYTGLYWVNLSKARLEGANLTNTVLERADLRGAHLQNARMSHAILQGANLEEANLQGADLEGANLQGADLGGAKLQKANLWRADLQKAVLMRRDLHVAIYTGGTKSYGPTYHIANLHEAYLKEANLQGAILGTPYATPQVVDLGRVDLEEADLRGAYLQGVKLSKAHLTRADLREANLQWAKLQGAHLVGADLRDANLQRTDLKGANLRGADLRGAKGLTKDQLLSAVNIVLAFYSEEHLEALAFPLDHNDRIRKKNLSRYNLKGLDLNFYVLRKFNLLEANLQEANLQEANLEDVDLQKADLYQANLQRASLSRTNLQEANLSGADLQKAKLRKTNLQKAKLWKANLQEADLGDVDLQKADLYQANLQRASLSRTNLQEANLSGADLQKAKLYGANLQKANLYGANLQGVDLRGTKNLTIEQLSKAKTLYKAKLDPELLEQIKGKYPHLWEEPKPEE